VVRFFSISLLALLLQAAPSFAREIVTLSNGSRISVEGHQIEGGKLLLQANGGVIEMPEKMFGSAEPDESVSATVPAEEAVKPDTTITVEPVIPVDPKQLVEEAARRWGLPPEFLHSVAKVESGYRPNAISPKGAIGIMQLMPATAKLLEADPFDPAQNVDAGARHLRDLLIQYDGQSGKALAAYNAGQAAVARYGGIPPYNETVLYVQKVLSHYNKLTKKSVVPTRQ